MPLTTYVLAALSALLWIGLAATLLYVGYRFVLGILSLRRRKPSPLGGGATRLCILVSAQDEEAVIADTVSCLLGLDYPPSQRRVFVVADACSDATEARARAAGATVLVKPGPAEGKGVVIHWALAQPEIADADWDALVLFDADSRPIVDVLRYLDGALAGGAQAIQCRSESRWQSGWVARAYAFNHSQRNRVWHQAREMAGLSATLTGTGICLTRSLLTTVPPVTKTLTEDLEYSAILIMKGIRIRYLYDAEIRIEQPHSLGSSVRQRLRWARGQIKTTWAYLPRLLARGITKRDLSAVDTALYLALPSLVPLQAGLLSWGIGRALLPGIWPAARIDGLPEIPVPLFFATISASVFLVYAGVAAERRSKNWKDWVAFTLLMASWLPIAAFAATTTWVRSWNRTPHGIADVTAVLPAPAAGDSDEPTAAAAAARQPRLSTGPARDKSS